MRQRSLLYAAGFLTLGAFTLVQTGCDMTEVQDAVENLDVILQLEPVETFVIGQILDASTGDLITQPVEITFSGEDAGVLIDAYSDPVTSLNTTSGYAAFGVQNAVTPSISSPVTVQVLASVSGYQPGSTTLVLSAKGDHTFNLYLTRLDAPPDGAEGTQANGTSAGLSLETAPEPYSSANTGLYVPAGTTLQDASGNTVSGNVFAQLAYFNNETVSALRAFPGGFNVTIDDGGSGQRRASLLAAAYSAVDVTAGGEPVFSASTPFTRSLGLPTGAVNPATGTAYQPGDVLGIYSYNETTGLWAFKTQTTVEASANKSGSDLFVQYETTEFTTDAAAQAFNQCSAGTTVNIDRNGHTGALTGYWLGPEGQSMLREALIPAGENTVTARNMPEGVAGVFRVLLADGGQAEVEVADLCGGSYQVALPAPTAPMETVKFGITFPCTLKLTAPVPGFSLTYKPAGAPGGGIPVPNPTWTAASESDGRITGGSMEIPGLFLNQPYAISFIFTSPDPAVGTLSESHDLTISSDEMTYAIEGHNMPSELCAASE